MKKRLAGRAVEKWDTDKNRSPFFNAPTPSTQVTPRRSGGRASRQKGNRVERAIVHALQEAGFAAERVPLSGAAGVSYLGDVSVPLLGLDRTVEVKARAHGFQQLYAWLEARDLLIVRADRREPLVVLPLRLAIEIATEANHRFSVRT